MNPKTPPTADPDPEEQAVLDAAAETDRAGHGPTSVHTPSTVREAAAVQEPRWSGPPASAAAIDPQD